MYPCMSATLDALESGAPKGVTGTNHDARLKSNLYGSGNVKSFAELQLSREETSSVGVKLAYAEFSPFQKLIEYAKRIYFI